MKEISAGEGNLFNCAATDIQVQIFFCSLCNAIPVRLQANPITHQQIGAFGGKKKKKNRSSGLILSLIKKC